jgi:hypothetical protein
MEGTEQFSAGLYILTETVPHSGDICEHCLVFAQTIDSREAQRNKAKWEGGTCRINPEDLHLIN